MLIPVVLFIYDRPVHLARVLECLRRNEIPLLEVFADGARRADDAKYVEESRALVRAIDWCEVRLTERNENIGLGRSILTGVSEVAARHEAFIVFEDDLTCVPGTYRWLCAALEHYANDQRVMSVTGWTHSLVRPDGVSDLPYFDGRAECWTWGTWSRCWRGMTDETATAKMKIAELRGVAPDAYGEDMPAMAAEEEAKNIWAVRWLYHHLQHGGLCLRPPRSMVEHIGFDESATNAKTPNMWVNPPLRGVQPPSSPWPESRENPACAKLWRNALATGFHSRLRRAVSGLLAK